ncbi:hypothetical protein P152DRAFT_71734 [Eremomyces bilateralis CBS 781.70]|uniref:MARVEL domain-containing protein n=1 Tax=Eremomyces bilateralis CBS 781.70 TaxID=1392243 RepID=A0A6G1G0D6_9PEZI|nr:uncharacterized protein P152DRAFT_71734 [Eremomyces bilateralis CBS 781.70]KAF1811391.1 hypothetical protein P152DRAFT_71734 [Eremomyces bilateralis CBS 781.70]
MPPRYRHDNTPWMKRILIPFWVVRNLFMIIMIGIYAVALGVVDHYTQTRSSNIAVLSIPLVLCAICVVLDITSIVLFAKRMLSPRVFLVFSVIQTLIWLGGFILDIVAISHGIPGGAIALSVLVFLAYAGTLIYASIVFHRYRKAGGRGAYTSAANPTNVQYQGTGHAPQQAVYEMKPQQQIYQQPQYGAGSEYYAQHMPQQIPQGMPQPYQDYSQQQRGMPPQGNLTPMVTNLFGDAHSGLNPAGTPRLEISSPTMVELESGQSKVPQGAVPPYVLQAPAQELAATK